MFIRFDTIHERDRHTRAHRHCMMAKAVLAYHRVAITACGGMKRAKQYYQMWTKMTIGEWKF